MKTYEQKKTKIEHTKKLTLIKYANKATGRQKRAVVSAAWNFLLRIFCKTLTFFKDET